MFWDVFSQPLEYRGVSGFPQGVSFAFENLRIFLGQKHSPSSGLILNLLGPFLFSYQYRSEFMNISPSIKCVTTMVWKS